MRQAIDHRATFDLIFRLIFSDFTTFAMNKNKKQSRN